MDGAAPSRDRATSLVTRLQVDKREGVRALRTLGVWTDDGPLPRADAVVAALAASPCPDLALRAAERVAERHGARALEDPEVLRRLGVIAGASDALADFVATRRTALAILDGELAPDGVEDMRLRCGRALADADEPGETIALVQRLGLLRVAARDLLGLADTPTAAAELSDLAAGTLAAALDYVAVDGARVAIIGMGKLGACELNYVSDIDVMFVHEGDRDAALRTAERVMRLLGDPVPGGHAYEVDANLRPEGRDGPLSRTLDAYGSYYERWAHSWEYQALLKARPVAGDPELGERFVELTRPFVYPDRRAAASIDDIQKMKGTVEASAAVRKAGAREVKLAPGGIRDIEFAVQLLQLVHGRHDPSLRSPNTLEALQALAEGGYVDDGDANLFGDAYQFLRTVEHRLQLRGLRRTHVVPADDGQRDRIARACGFRTIRVATALEQFDRELARVQGYVRRLHEQLFYRPLLSRFAELTAADQLPLPSGELGHEAATDRLVALGFGDAQRALRDLEALAGGVTRRARLMRTLLPTMMPVLAATPDPNGGLSSFRSLAERLEKAPAFLRTLRDNPPVGEALARVLGSSRVVGEWLEREPELVGELAGDAQDLLASADDLARTAGGLLRRGESAEQTADALRRFKRRGVARIAVADLTGQAAVTEVAETLTGLAEATLGAGVELAVRDAPVRFAVIGMGKLGACELSYASDLDVILVFDPPSARDEALDAADQLVAVVSAITSEGQAFRVDLGLRPEGRDGPATRTLESTIVYYRQWAEPWELQALTQARVVAGDRDVGEALLDAVTPLVYPERLPTERLQSMRLMKARVERERTDGRTRRTRPTRTPGAAARAAAGGLGQRIDLKLGPGGLSDVDWTAQMLALRYGGTRPALRTPGTLRVLRAAEDEGLLDPQDAEWLSDGWQFLTRLRNALYLRGARDTATLPPGPLERDQLARAIGYPSPGGQALTEDVGRVMRRVRRVHERVFYET